MSTVRAVPIVAFVAVGLVRASASADDDETAPPPPEAPAERAAQPKADPVVVDDFKSIAITANPLSLAIGRFGLNLEYLPIRHHGFMINPYYETISADFGDGAKEHYSWLGGEIGYHFYTGDRGANGFWIGPQLLWNHIHTSYSCGTAASCGGSGDLTAYGFAIDLGGQTVFDNGFTIGGGGGLMHLYANAAGSHSSTLVHVEGTLPRFLFTIGYSF